MLVISSKDTRYEANVRQQGLPPGVMDTYVHARSRNRSEAKKQLCETKDNGTGEPTDEKGMWGAQGIPGLREFRAEIQPVSWLFAPVNLVGDTISYFYVEL